MQAFADGKKIEYRVSPSDSWQEINSPTWNWCRYLYRVKPEPSLRPYKNAEEFFKAQKEHGLYLHDKKDKTIGYFPFRVTDFCATWYTTTATNTVYYDFLLKEYQWQDGSICGILE